MAISAGGLISGLDVSKLIEASMAYDKLPLQRLQSQLSSTESKISAMGKVKSAIASLQEAAKNLSNSDDLRAFKGTLSNNDLASVSVSNKAASGTYQVEVTQLATSHKLASAGGIDVSAGGSLQISAGGGSQVPINVAAGSSLSDLAKSINDSGAGVSAAIVNGENGQQLVLTSKESGKAGEISITSNIAGANLDFNPANPTGNPEMTQTEAAQNAIVKVDGITLANTTSNTIVDGMNGVTLTLKATGTTQLSISNDDSVLETKVKAFVDAYNSARSTLQSLTKYDIENKGKNSGALSGDSTLNGIMNELRGLLTQNSGASKAYVNLSFIGVESTRDGTLAFKADKFSAAAKADFASMSQTLSAFASAFDATTTRMNSSNGIITRQVEGLNSTTRTLNDGIRSQESRLAIVQERYEKKFASLETLLSSMQKTGTQLTQQLATLNK